VSAKKTKLMNKAKVNERAKTFLDSCVSLLRKDGSRITQPRLLVINCLGRSDSPLTAREVHEIISKDKKASNIDQVSVYRILEALLKLELVHQVFPSGGYLACFHIKCGAAVHVLTRCSSCEQIEELDLPQEAIAPILRYLKTKQHFQPDSHLFQMNGLCSECRES